MSWLGRLLGNSGARPTRPVCRLTETQALQIAGTVLGGHAPLLVRDVAIVAGRVEWTIGTATTGSGRVARINDATGDVLAVERWGLR
jgi:hypothetical protein